MATLKQIDSIRAGKTEVITINGGPQITWKGTVNPGTNRQISYQALLALVVITTVGVLRPESLRAGADAYRAYGLLLKDTADEDTRRLLAYSRHLIFAGIPVIRDTKLPSDCIQATITLPGNKKLIGRLTGIAS